MLCLQHVTSYGVYSYKTDVTYTRVCFWYCYSLGLSLELLLQVVDLALQGEDGGLALAALAGLQLAQLGLQLLVLSLQQHPPALQLLCLRPLRCQLCNSSWIKSTKATITMVLF